MWGDGGRFYWGDDNGGRAEAEGIVVMFAWISIEQRHLRRYVELYASLGWRSLVCHADFLTFFSPDKAASLADGMLRDLVQELRDRPAPVVFAPFSGGIKGCMYKAFQLIDSKCEGQLSMGEYQLIKDCLCGCIYDSSPMDFSSDIGTRFILHPNMLKVPHPPRIVSWLARAITSGLDNLFISSFESQRADYWQTLHSSVSVGPCLIFCSEDDDLAPIPVVCSFARCLQELGGDVKLTKWSNSPHVGHYKHHAADYRNEVTGLLRKAIATFSERQQRLHRERMGKETPLNICNFDKAAESSNGCLMRGAIDDLFLPSATEHQERRDACSTQDEQKGDVFHVQSTPNISAHGVLGQILFDVCVPKNVQGWDIKPSMSLSRRQTFGSALRHRPLNPMKFLRSSKL